MTWILAVREVRNDILTFLRLKMRVNEYMAETFQILFFG